MDQLSAEHRLLYLQSLQERPLKCEGRVPDPAGENPAEISILQAGSLEVVDTARSRPEIIIAVLQQAFHGW